MVRTGFQISEEAKTAYAELQSGHKHNFIIFKIDESNAANPQIVPEVVRSKDAGKFDYSEFEKALNKADGARYAVLDYNYQENGIEKSKVVFFLWSPDDKGSVQARMKYSGSKDGFKKNLNGIQKDIEAHSEAEIEESEVLKKCLG
jgi:cofilin